MDASASLKVDDDVKDAYAYYLKIENKDFPTPCKQRSTVIKYTKLPEFENYSQVSWPCNSNTLQPRFRRIITLEDPLRFNTSRSLKLHPFIHHTPMSTNVTNRKIVTISEDDGYDLHPKFSNEGKSTTMSNRAVETKTKKKNPKQSSQRNTSRLTSAKLTAETRSADKRNKAHDNEEATPRSRYKKKNSDRASFDNIWSQTVMEKDKRKSKSASLSRSSLSKNLMRPNEREQQVSVIKPTFYEELSSKPYKKSIEKAQDTESPLKASKRRSMLLEMKKKSNLTPVIHVPLEEKCRKHNTISDVISHSHIEKPTFKVYADSSVNTDIVLHRDVNTCTQPSPGTTDRVTDMDGFEPHISYKCIETSDLQARLTKEKFDDLEIPNVSLIKDKFDFKDELYDLHSKSLPNLEIPTMKMKNNRKEKSVLDTHYSKSTSYIISRATLTYKTQQKINVHVVDSKNKTYSNQSPSPLAYPMTVVSLFNDEMRSKEHENNISQQTTQKSKSSKKYKNSMNEIKSLNCSYIPNSNTLMKPSDVISTISINNSLLQSVLLCEQFQNELNFIDSFFESLHYLESCSLSGKCYKDENIDKLVNVSPLLDSDLDAKNSDYENFFSKFENGAISDDETMASKNIYLLNILIRDEQRRAKNLLCVLKKREVALKDFTKSQILYLENKKKQDNTDISALKKKQRGALLKLQHECGEMQRMRKALLALSEKRKITLMKTKKDLELKLKNNVDVDQIIVGKKKLKRNQTVDRTTAPLKCFDLTSSGCEDSTTSRYASDGGASSSDTAVAEPVTKVLTSADKGIQTVDSLPISTAHVEIATNTTDENLVVVDGGYLNILFHNLCLPHIFSSGKQYEVNREALKKIVDSTNLRQGAVENWSDVVEKLMNQSKNDEEGNSSTPSTARSLVEEFEQYYKSLGEEERVEEVESHESGSVSPSKLYDVSEAVVQTSLCKIKSLENKAEVTSELECVKMTVETSETVVVEDACETVVVEEACETALNLTGLAGPLPVPPGAPHVPEPINLDSTAACTSPKSSSTTCPENNASSPPPCEVPSPSLTLEPSHAEAEELRRQQLAIEREIKELEQQQSQLLVVRAIPDKPPPPYTPPVETRQPKHPRRFLPDEITPERIQNYITKPTESAYDPTDAFDVLVHDFCEETVQSHKSELSDKPWSSCNLLPQKPPLDTEELITVTSAELCDVLSPVTPSLVSGVSSRRTDQIDDILFAEWRGAEPEWTSLHTDESIVKNQLFETIFQKLITDTVDEYKRSVLSPPPIDQAVVL